MVSHRAPEQRTLLAGATAAPGPVEPVDTGQTPTQTIDIASQETAPGSKRPEPVMRAATLAGAISGVILTVGGLLKLITRWIPAEYDLQTLADSTSDAIVMVGVAWATVGPWITARVKARDKVTPLSDPRDSNGQPLVPVTSLGARR